MARSPTLNKEALLRLGAERLADLTLDEAERNRSFKRLVMAALASAKGPDAVAAIVDKRLAGLERARGAVGWERAKTFGDDLAATLKIITGELAKSDVDAAADRLMRLLATADRTLSRMGDDAAARVYHAAAAALPALIGRLSPEANASLPDRLYALTTDTEFDFVLESLPDILAQSPASVVDALDARLAQALRAIGPIADDDRDWRKRLRARRLIETRQRIADSRDDVDAFIALETGVPGSSPDAAKIAARLIGAGRHREALGWLRRPAKSGVKRLTRADFEAGLAARDPRADRRARLEIVALDALGERAEARALRWKTFEVTLDADALRDHLAHLPDFADVEALDAALAHALATPLIYAALRFLIAWPRLDLAERLAVERRAQWDGRYYGILTPAAQALESAQPLAATVLYRALIDSILTRGQSPAYPHAARYYAELEALAPREDRAWPIDGAPTYRAAAAQAAWAQAGVLGSDRGARGTIAGP